MISMIYWGDYAEWNSAKVTGWATPSDPYFMPSPNEVVALQLHADRAERAPGSPRRRGAPASANSGPAARAQRPGIHRRKSDRVMQSAPRAMVDRERR